jgi:hypothetical protein
MLKIYEKSYYFFTKDFIDNPNNKRYINQIYRNNVAKIVKNKLLMRIMKQRNLKYIY